MITFEADTSDLKALAIVSAEMPGHVREEMHIWLLDAGMLLTFMVAARTPVNYGILRASIGWPYGFEVREAAGFLVDQIQGIVGASNQVSLAGTSPFEYVHYVEEGTRPHWPPIGPLKLWAIRKFPGGVTLRSGEHVSAERFAYMVQSSIAKKGTKGAHMFKRAWNEGGRDGVERTFREVPVRVIERFERGLAAS